MKHDRIQTSSAAEIARRVAAQRQLVALARNAGGHSYDVAAAFATIGAVAGALMLVLAVLSAG